MRSALLNQHGKGASILTWLVYGAVCALLGMCLSGWAMYNKQIVASAINPVPWLNQTGFYSNKVFVCYVESGAAKIQEINIDTQGVTTTTVIASGVDTSNRIAVLVNSSGYIYIAVKKTGSLVYLKSTNIGDSTAWGSENSILASAPTDLWGFEIDTSNNIYFGYSTTTTNLYIRQLNSSDTLQSAVQLINLTGTLYIVGSGVAFKVSGNTLYYEIVMTDDSWYGIYVIKSIDSGVTWKKTFEGNWIDATIPLNNPVSYSGTLGASPATPTWSSGSSNCKLPNGNEKCLYFDGGDYITSVDNPFDITGDVTIEAWIKTTASGESKMIAYKYDTTAGWLLFVDSTGKAKFDIRTSGGGYQSSGASTTTVNTGSLFHILGRREGSRLSIFVNGVEESYITTANTGTLSNTTSLRVGYGNAANYFIGYIDNIAIWNQAITTTSAPSISQRYNGGNGAELVCVNGLIASYMFNETSGMDTKPSCNNYGESLVESNYWMYAPSIAVRPSDGKPYFAYWTNADQEYYLAEYSSIWSKIPISYGLTDTGERRIGILFDKNDNFFSLYNITLTGNIQMAYTRQLINPMINSNIQITTMVHNDVSYNPSMMYDSTKDVIAFLDRTSTSLFINIFNTNSYKSHYNVLAGGIGNYYSFPTTTVAPNGDIIAWVTSGLDHAGPSKVIKQYRSIDEGITWTYEGIKHDPVDSTFGAQAGVVVRDGGNIFAAIREYNNTVPNVPVINQINKIRKSTDNGTTWGTTINIADQVGYVETPWVVLPNGDAILPTYTIGIANSLLHGNGTDGSTTFTDSTSQHTWSVNGSDTQIDTAQSKFGGASILFDGSGDYLSSTDHADFDFSGGIWTIDTWARINSLSGWSCIFSVSTDANTYMYGCITSTGSVKFVIASAGTGIVVAETASSTIGLNTWYHIMFKEYGDSYRIYVNGISQASVTDTDRSANYTGDYIIGSFSGGSFYKGWLDEFRISKYSGWTADLYGNYDPPEVPYPDWAAKAPGSNFYPMIMRSLSADSANRTTWTMISDLTVTGVNLNEGSIAYNLNNDKLIVIFRSEDGGPWYKSTSTGNNPTVWTTPTSMGFTGHSDKPILQYTSDYNILIFCYGNRNMNSPPANEIFGLLCVYSHDDGVTWRDGDIIYSIRAAVAGGDYGYSTITLIPNSNNILWTTWITDDVTNINGQIIYGQLTYNEALQTIFPFKRYISETLVNKLIDSNAVNPTTESPAWIAFDGGVDPTITYNLSNSIIYHNMVTASDAYGWYDSTTWQGNLSVNKYYVFLKVSVMSENNRSKGVYFEIADGTNLISVSFHKGYITLNDGTSYFVDFDNVNSSPWGFLELRIDNGNYTVLYNDVIIKSGVGLSSTTNDRIYFGNEDGTFVGTQYWDNVSVYDIYSSSPMKLPYNAPWNNPWSKEKNNEDYFINSARLICCRQ